MNPHILFIDDDPYALAGYARIARKGFEVETATGGEEGLRLLQERGPFAAVVSDMRMPGLNGAEVLARARAMAPDTTRILLTGHADIESAIDAVNRGHMFRFLTKPCPPDILTGALTAAAQQHALIVSERDLRERTLQGTIKILTDVMAMVHPTAWGRVGRVRDLVVELGNKLNAEPAWELPLVASLSLLGTVALPDGVLARALAGDKVSDRERALLESHPRIAFQMLSGVPQLQGVAEAVLYQGHRYDGNSGMMSYRRGADVPIGSRLLKVAADFEALVGRGFRRDQALAELNKRHGWYDPEVLDALSEVVQSGPPPARAAVAVSDLMPGMVLYSAVRYEDGTVLIKEGQPLTDPLIYRVRTVAASVGVQEPIEVLLSSAVAPKPHPSAQTQIGERPTDHGIQVAAITTPEVALQEAFPEVFQRS